MPRYLIAFLLAAMLSFNGAAQEDDASADTGVEAADAAEAAGEAADDEDIEDADLDEQTYEENEDDFIPTEEIPADEPIPFPSNI